LAPDKTVCEGDTLELNPGVYSSYLWSTSDTSSSIYFDTTAQEIHVTVTNSSGCIALSDTINVTWRPVPSTSNIVVTGNGDSLNYSTSMDVQWYFNNNVIPMATDTFHQALNNGEYFVEVTDSFGCSNTSDTVTVTGIGIEEVADDVFNIYPNPTSGNITIELGTSEIEGIAVYNVVGEQLLSKFVNPQETRLELDISAFAEGVYYIRLTSKEDKYLRRLILLR
jgi:hypothetical protein